MKNCGEISDAFMELPPHLRHVTTLPCEIQKSFFNSKSFRGFAAATGKLLEHKIGIILSPMRSCSLLFPRQLTATGKCDVYYTRIPSHFQNFKFIMVLVVSSIKTSIFFEFGDKINEQYGRHAADTGAAASDVDYWRCLVKVKVKASHTRYRALGSELIPVYRQSACR